MPTYICPNNLHKQEAAHKNKDNHDITINGDDITIDGADNGPDGGDDEVRFGSDIV